MFTDLFFFVSQFGCCLHHAILFPWFTPSFCFAFLAVSHPSLSVFGETRPHLRRRAHARGFFSSSKMNSDLNLLGFWVRRAGTWMAQAARQLPICFIYIFCKILRNSRRHRSAPSFFPLHQFFFFCILCDAACVCTSPHVSIPFSRVNPF